ncbi:MAG: TorF family putative porin [Kangiellaceae bacterium]|nr:TorF family putative porin [Kangiellaceae bacterium]MCW8998147.1 TorF family putative porin [Kangiellaceae bacterium]
MCNKKTQLCSTNRKSREDKPESSTIKSGTGILAVCTCLISQNLCAEQPSISISIASESVNHGISLSNEEPTIGLSYDHNLSDNFFVGAEVSIHKTSGPNKRQGWQHIYGGYFISLEDDKALSFSLSRYTFNADFPASWDYNQLRVDLSLAFSLAVSYSYSDSYYGRGNNSQRIELSWLHHFNEKYTLSTAAGLTKPEKHVYLEDFVDANISVTRHFERGRFNIGYHYVDDSSEFIHGLQNTDPRLTLTYEWDLY